MRLLLLLLTLLSLTVQAQVQLNIVGALTNVGQLNANQAFTGSNYFSQPIGGSLATWPMNLGATLSIAPTNYAVEGQEANIYFDNIIRSPIPTDELAIDVTCDAGTQYQDFFRITPTNTASSNYSLAISVSDSSTTNTLASYSGTLRVSPNSAGIGITRKILIIGDSTTAGGQVITELVRKASTNLFALTALGTQGTYTNLHEGHSGWTFSNFYNSGASNPFTNGAANSTFDFNFYLTNNTYTMSSNDWVVFNLGINDIFGYTSDSTAASAATAAMGVFSNMFWSVTNTVPGIRVGLCVTIPPSQSQDAFGNNYNTGQTYKRYRRNRFILAETILSYPLGYKIPIDSALDTLHNMPTTTVAYNAQNTNTFAMLSNGVHPASSGYLQIADEMWAFLKGNETNSIYNPTNLPGATAAAWWLGSDLATNGGVLTIADRSGNNRNLTNQAATSLWPTKQASALNSIDGVLFNGATVTNYLRFCTNTIAQPFESWIVYSLTNYDDAQAVFILHGINSLSSVAKSSSALSISAPTTANICAIITNRFYLLNVVYNGASSVGYTNNTATATVNPGVNGIGNVFTVGANHLNQYAAQMVFMEGGIYSAALSADNRTNLYNYIRNKYNIP